MGSGHDYKSDEEIAAEKKAYETKKKEFLTRCIKWFDDNYDRHYLGQKLVTYFDKYKGLVVEDISNKILVIGKEL
jgi:hypothetical protein